jgi:hypothetical protein
MRAERGKTQTARLDGLLPGYLNGLEGAATLPWKNSVIPGIYVIQDKI